MISADLPRVADVSGSEELRTLCAKVISTLEVDAARRGGETAAAVTLSAFFTACVAACDAVAPAP